MNLKKATLLSLVLLIASFATAQIPCNPTTLRAATSSVNWPQFQYDAAHTGCNPYEAILKPSNVAQLTQKWVYRDGPTEYTSSVLSNGVIYVSYFMDDPFFFGGVVAINANTGAEIWGYSNDDEVHYTSAAVANGMVFVGSTDNSLYALNANTGAIVWQYDTSTPIYSTPTVANGVVYVGSPDKNLYALNAATGALLWKCATGAAQASPTVANGVVYVSSDQLYALNASTGTLIWKYPASGLKSPAVAFNTVYAASDQLYALNAKTGALIWKYPVVCTVSPAVSKDTVYVGADKLYALNRSTGALLWAYTFPDGQFGETPSQPPSVANGVVYDSSYEHVVAVDAVTGGLLWSYGGGEIIFSSVVVANGSIFVNTASTEDSDVYAFSINQ
jgi:outer membrane protein assembly factor BamB